MSRFYCEKKQELVGSIKGNDCCMIKKRCPHLMVKMWEKHLRKYIRVPVVPRSMTEGSCEDGKNQKRIIGYKSHK